MNNTDLDLDLIRGTDRFLRLHIDDLSRPIQRSPHMKTKLDASLTTVILTAAITGFVIGTIAAYLLGLVP